MGTRGLIALIAAGAAFGIGAATVAAKGGKGRADSGTVYAAITHTVGSTEYAAGNTTDKVLGTGTIAYTIKVGAGSTPGTFKTTGGVIAFTKTGELGGTTSATATVGAGGAVTFTNGTFKLTKGYGGQKGHSYIGTFTGSGSSATGPFVFHIKGTYR